MKQSMSSNRPLNARASEYLLAGAIEGIDKVADSVVRASKNLLKTSILRTASNIPTGITSSQSTGFFPNLKRSASGFVPGSKKIPGK